MRIRQLTLPHKVKMQYVNFRSHTKYFLLSWKIPEEISRQSMLFHMITKGSIYYIKHMYIQPFSMEVDWPEIWHLMEVSTMFYNCTCCIFTLWGRTYHIGCWYVGGNLGLEIGVQLYERMIRSANRKLRNKLATNRSCLNSFWKSSVKCKHGNWLICKQNMFN